MTDWSSAAESNLSLACISLPSLKLLDSRKKERTDQPASRTRLRHVPGRSLHLQMPDADAGVQPMRPRGRSLRGGCLAVPGNETEPGRFIPTFASLAVCCYGLHQDTLTGIPDQKRWLAAGANFIYFYSWSLHGSRQCSRPTVSVLPVWQPVNHENTGSERLSAQRSICQ